MRIALTIGGSDSGGGAGIQADLRTFHQYGVFGTSVITAVTAQNTHGVSSWERVSPKLVREQIAAVATDLRPNAVKTGMLADAELASAVAGELARHDLTRGYVLDPVMVATSGDVLLEPAAVRVIREQLLPLAHLATPNLPEAEILLDIKITSVEDLERAARLLVTEFGARAALVKGSHLRGETITDVLFDGQTAHHLAHRRVETTSTHGTGCTLSAAIVAQLARDAPLLTAVQSARRFVHRALASAPGLGAGHGPLNHFVEPD